MPVTPDLLVQLEACRQLGEAILGVPLDSIVMQFESGGPWSAVLFDDKNTSMFVGIASSRLSAVNSLYCCMWERVSRYEHHKISTEQSRKNMRELRDRTEHMFDVGTDHDD